MNGLTRLIIQLSALLYVRLDRVHATSLFSVEDFPEGQFVSGELRAAEREESKVLESLLPNTEEFAEHVLQGVTKRRLLTAGALAYVINPNLDRCQGQPDPAHSQEFISEFSRGAGAAMELAQQAEMDPTTTTGRFGALQIAAAPSPTAMGTPNLRVATLHIPASPSTLAEVADAFVSGMFQALSSCAIPTCNYKLRLVDKTKEEQRTLAFSKCGSIFCPLVQGINADLAVRNIGSALSEAMDTALSVPHGPFENETFANVGALQACITMS
eukprot:jgi/Botrbrau1/20557/Bobra.145_2s0104.1